MVLEDWQAVFKKRGQWVGKPPKFELKKADEVQDWFRLIWATGGLRGGNLIAVAGAGVPREALQVSLQGIDGTTGSPTANRW
jgi:hypothetical protein